MIRLCGQGDLVTVHEIISDASRAYKGVIPADRWHEPYMTRRELDEQIEQGVAFWGYWDVGELVGVMGLQDVQDVTLVRHAYVRTARQNQGIGGHLLQHLCGLSERPLLIGTWADAVWAIRFYEKHGFSLVSSEETATLLHRYWRIPERQVETSVVLANDRWWDEH